MFTSYTILHVAALIAVFLRGKNLGIAIRQKDKGRIKVEILMISLVIAVWLLVNMALTRMP
jgi:hypothetical protein